MADLANEGRRELQVSVLSPTRALAYLGPGLPGPCDPRSGVRPGAPPPRGRPGPSGAGGRTKGAPWPGHWAVREAGADEARLGPASLGASRGSVAPGPRCGDSRGRLAAGGVVLPGRGQRARR